VPAGDATLLFSSLKDFKEILPEPNAPGAIIPADPIQPPEIVVPEPQPAPEIAPAEEEKVPERVVDVGRLGLHYIIENILKDNGFRTVRDVSFFARNNGGQALLDCKGISDKRLKVILEAVEALEAA
jgi:hypothetical protein